jgi:hypothetical protein
MSPANDKFVHDYLLIQSYLLITSIYFVAVCMYPIWRLGGFRMLERAQKHLPGDDITFQVPASRYCSTTMRYTLILGTYPINDAKEG